MQSINGQTNTARIPVAQEVVFSNSLLQHWENSVYVHAPSIRMTGFTLRKKLTSRSRFEFASLSPDWTGECSIYRISGNGETLIHRCMIEFSDADAHRGKTLHDRNVSVDDLSKGSLLESLDGFISFILGAVNETPHSPVRGGFFLFYDLNASTYRVPHWMWTWGPAIKLLLEADTHRHELAVSGEEDLTSVGERAGRVSLGFLERNPAHPAHGLITVRWNTRIDTERGFQQYLSPADTNFLVGWGWIPLFEKTGNVVFLEAAKQVAEAESRLVAKFGIPPMDYIQDDETWKNFTVDEAGFTPRVLRRFTV